MDGAPGPSVRSDGTAAHVAGWELERPSSDAVARSLSRGSNLEYLGCLCEALLVYEGALAAQDDRRSALDAGRLTHRIGLCAFESGDGPRGFASLLDAGRRARDLGMRAHCGESLAAAGWGLLMHPFAMPPDGAVDGDLVAAAFDGVVEEARKVLLMDGTPDLEQAMVVHGRFAGLTFLSAEALLDEAQSAAAEALHFGVLTPFHALHDVRSKTEADEAAVIAFMTNALARLCRDLGEQGRRRRAGLPPIQEAVAAMARHLDDAFVVDLREPLRGWLSARLSDRSGADRTTAARPPAAGDGWSPERDPTVAVDPHP